MRKTFVEFFAGIGLVRQGLEGAGWRAQFATDIDEKKQKMYSDNFQDAHEKYILADIDHLKSYDIPSVELATASFPCTDLSLAGNRRGLAGEQSGTFWAFTRLLGDLNGRRPPLLLIENVPGFVTSHQGQDFRDAIVTLNQLGYSCDAFTLNAVNFVPQSRLRVFLIGVYDAPVTRDNAQRLATRGASLLSQPLASFISRNQDLRWHVLDLPRPPTHRGSLASILERLPESSARWWEPKRVRYLLDQMSPLHRKRLRTLERSDKLQYATVYRRVRYGRSMAELRTDGIAGCLRTPRGGSSRQILVIAGKGRIRVRFMTPREYARLMGANDYRIDVPDNQAYFGFGDAVCVPAIRWIAEHCLGPLVDQSASSSPGERVVSFAAVGAGVSP